MWHHHVGDECLVLGDLATIVYEVPPWREREIEGEEARWKETRKDMKRVRRKEER